jgi:hypothetical protein
MLQVAKKESGPGDEQAMQLKTEAVNAKDLLDALLRVESVLKARGLDGAAMQKEPSRLRPRSGEFHPSAPSIFRN